MKQLSIKSVMDMVPAPVAAAKKVSADSAVITQSISGKVAGAQVQQKSGQSSCSKQSE